MGRKLGLEKPESGRDERGDLPNEMQRAEPAGGRGRSGAGGTARCVPR